MAESVVLRLELKIASLERKLAAAERRMSRTEKRFKAIGSQIQGHLAGMFAIGAVSNFAQSQVELIKKIDQSNRALKAITGTTEEYNRAKLMLSESAEEFGVNVLDLTKSYVRFYAASKSSTLATKELDAIFNKMTKSAAVLGLSADETHGVLKALEQMLSKSKVQAEELRGQLGDRLPGAFVIMAESMGVTTEELDKMLKKGGVMADEVLPNFAAAYEKAIGADQIKKVDTLVAAFERFNTAWIKLVEGVDDGGGVISNSIKGILNSTTFLIDSLGNLNTQQFINFLQNPINLLIFGEARREVSEFNKAIKEQNELIEENLRLQEVAAKESSVGMGPFPVSNNSAGTVSWSRLQNERAEAEKKRAAEIKKASQEALEASEKERKAVIRNLRLENERIEKIREAKEDYHKRAEAAIDAENKIADAMFAASEKALGEPGGETVDKYKYLDDELSRIDIIIARFREKGKEITEEQANLVANIEGIIANTTISLIDALSASMFDKKIDPFAAIKEVLGRGLISIGGALIAHSAVMQKLQAALADPFSGLGFAAGAAAIVAGNALIASARRDNAAMQSKLGGGGSRGGSGRTQGFIGTQTSQSIQFEPIMLRLQGKDLVGAIRVNDRDASL